MRNKLQRLTVLLFATLMFCVLLSPAALAAERDSRNPLAALEQYAQQALIDALRGNADACDSKEQLHNAILEYLCGQYQPSRPTPPVKPEEPQKPGTPGTVEPPVTPSEPDPEPEPKPTPEPEPEIPAGTSAYAAEVVRLVNVERANYGLSALTMDKQLNQAAQIRAAEARVNFSHTRPNGTSCFTVLNELSISYRSAGENIALGQRTPAEVVKAWMNSSGHRDNILGNFSKIGIGVVESGSGYAWAQMFTR